MHLRAERAALREDATRLIDELGGTVHEVTMSLGCLGVQVGLSDPDDSPAARYLHAIIGGDNRVKQVKVTTRWLELKTHRRWSPTIWVPLPCAVSQLTASRPGFAPGSGYWVDTPTWGWF
jgi:hypothetical protein